MAMIADLDRHVIDRFLAAPASRFAIILSQVVRAGITAMLQALLLLLVGLALGVRVHGGVARLARRLRRIGPPRHDVRRALARHRAARAPGGDHDRGGELHRPAADVPLGHPDPDNGDAELDQAVSRFNPVNWGVQRRANAIVTGDDWSATGVYLLLLLAAAAVTSSFATWCFRSYQRSL